MVMVERSYQVHKVNIDCEHIQPLSRRSLSKERVYETRVDSLIYSFLLFCLFMPLFPLYSTPSESTLRSSPYLPLSIVESSIVESSIVESLGLDDQSALETLCLRMNTSL